MPVMWWVISALSSIVTGLSFIFLRGWDLGQGQLVRLTKIRTENYTPKIDFDDKLRSISYSIKEVKDTTVDHSFSLYTNTVIPILIRPY